MITIFCRSSIRVIRSFALFMLFVLKSRMRTNITNYTNLAATKSINFTEKSYYAGRLALAVLIALALSAPLQTASAEGPEDPEYWTDMGSASIRKGERYSAGGYTVEFADCEGETDSVYLSLWREDELLDESVLNASCVNETFCTELDTQVCDYLNWDDEVIVAIKNETEDHPESESPSHWADPLIHIDLYSRAKPEISLKIKTNCEVYTPLDSEIRVTVEIENVGGAVIENTTVTIDPGDLQATSDIKSHFGSLSAEDDDSRYLWFTWNDVPGNTNEEDRFLRYLWDDLGFGWTKNANADIKKSSDGDTIRIKRGDDSAEIAIDSREEGATLKIGGEVHAFDVVEEGSELNIYIASDDAVDTEETVYARLRVPQSITEMEGQSFTISVNATGSDEEGVKYSESASTEILVLPRFDLAIKKTVNSQISMDQTVWVRIDLENTGIRDLKVSLNDTIPSGFRLCGNETLEWGFNITPGESLHYSYRIKPGRPGIFDVPCAVAEFEIGYGRNVSVRSYAPEIVVDGACITLNKTAHPGRISEGGRVTVTLNIANTGNMDVLVNLTDVIPKGAELVSGDRTIHTILGANQTNGAEYVVVISSPGIMALGLPMMSISGSSYCYMTATEMPTIEVMSEELSPGPEPKRTQESLATSGAPPRSADVSFYETALAICMFGAVFLIGRFMR